MKICKYALLLNEGIPRALKGKKLRLKIPRVLPLIFELFLVFQIWGQNTIGGQYLQKINALIFWYKYLQKINAMPSDCWWKKYKFCRWQFLICFLKYQKLFVKEAKKFFHQKSEGIAFTFCRYLNQNMREFIFCRYCPPIVFYPQIWMTKMNSKIEGNTLGILRRSFFPFNALGMPSFNNSVAYFLSWTYQKLFQDMGPWF